MQIFTLETKNEQTKSLEQDQYLGLALETNDPFHLAIRIPDLDQNNVKVLIYSIGSKKEVLWGYYNFLTQKFSWESSCKFRIGLLTRFLKSWSEKGYETVANVVTNRINRVMNYMLGNDKALTYPEYKALKQIYLYRIGKVGPLVLEDELKDVDLTTLYKKLGFEPIKYPELDYEVEPEPKLDSIPLEQIETAIQEYETTLNLSAVDHDVLEKVVGNEDRLYEIVSKFHQDVQYGKYNTNSFYTSLNDCLTEDDCKKAGYYPESCDLYTFLNEVELS